MSGKKIILASTSVFRKSLLEKLHLDFTTAKPEVDETPLANETVKEMVERLSLKKAEKIANNEVNKIIIASDQAAMFNDLPIGKPHNYENAVKQLSSFSNQTITFYTGLVVINQTSNQTFQDMEITKVSFRELSKQDIHNYVLLEKPYQCAGSFKSEGLGISLFKSIETQDPNALIGLPLIKLTNIFKEIDVQVPPKP
jgi:MAF protein